MRNYRQVATRRMSIADDVYHNRFRNSVTIRFTFRNGHFFSPSDIHRRTRKIVCILFSYSYCIPEHNRHIGLAFYKRVYVCSGIESVAWTMMLHVGMSARKSTDFFWII